MKKDKEYLKAAAAEVERQLMENPDLAIPVDPDVAEYMGAFEETALTEADVEDDALRGIDDD